MQSSSKVGAQIKEGIAWQGPAIEGVNGPAQAVARRPQRDPRLTCCLLEPKQCHRRHGLGTRGSSTSQLRVQGWCKTSARDRRRLHRGRCRCCPFLRRVLWRARPADGPLATMPEVVVVGHPSACVKPPVDLGTQCRCSKELGRPPAGHAGPFDSDRPEKLAVPKEFAQRRVALGPCCHTAATYLFIDVEQRGEATGAGMIVV